MNKEVWIGSWKNFELYFNDPAYAQAWQEAEEVIKAKKKNLIEKYLWKKGAKQFWIDYCYTVTKENKIQLKGMNINIVNNTFQIEWIDIQDNTVTYEYILDEIIQSGLEKKVNYLLKTNEETPFKYLLLMEPMPDKNDKNHGGLISHFHFQFSQDKNNIVKKDKLKQPHWYATMCDKEATIQQECNIIYALHGIEKRL